MIKCPLCEKFTLATYGQEKICVNGKCGYTYPMGNASDINLNEVMPYLSKTSKNKMNKWLKLKEK